MSTTAARPATFAAALALLALPLLAAPAAAQPGTTYRVTITNLTASQIISPPVVATHRVGTGIFQPGDAAGDGLRLLAEDGDPSDLAAELMADHRVLDVAVASGPVMPGASVRVEVEARGPFNRLSAAGMLVTTNDAFFGVDSAVISGGPWLTRLAAPAYDAGTEANSEDCAFIPGPPCGSAGVRDTGGAEGFIHVHRGIQGTGDLAPAVWDWRSPVVRVTVARLPG